NNSRQRPGASACGRTLTFGGSTRHRARAANHHPRTKLRQTRHANAIDKGEGDPTARPPCIGGPCPSAANPIHRPQIGDFTRPRALFPRSPARLRLTKGRDPPALLKAHMTPETLHPALAAALAAKGYDTLTPVQALMLEQPETADLL